MNTNYEITEKILEEHPSARENKHVFMYFVFKEFGWDIPDFFKDMKYGKIPDFESLRRNRQIIQNEEKRFVASDKVQIARKEKEKRCKQGVLL